MAGEARSPYARAAVAGVIAAVGMIYLATVGLAGTFAERPIVAGIGEGAGVVTLGRFMLVAVPFLTALVVAARWRGGVEPVPVGSIIAASVVLGAVAGALFGAFLLVIATFDLSGIFIPLTESLVEFLSYGQEPIVGAVIWIGIATVSALLAGLLELLDARDRRAILTAIGIVILTALLEPIVEPILGGLGLDAINDFIFQDGGLSPAAAALIAGVVIAYMWATSNPASPVQKQLAGMSDERRRQARLAGVILGIIAVLAIPLVATGFVSLTLLNVGLYLMLALGLNIVVGYAGLLDLGYVAFFAVGAYTMGLLTAPSSALGGPMSSFGPEWAFWLALPVVLLAAALVGILIGAPVLRLRGDYLAIVTLGFGEIARVLVESDALRSVLGGPNGIVGLPGLYLPFIGELSGPAEYYYPVLFFAALAAFIAWRLSRSRTGRAWNAMREDESVAESTGINTTNYKLLAFALGGTLGGLAGALYAVQLSTVFPGGFTLLVSITVLAIIILGGMGTIRGVIAGALILVGLPDALREFGQYRFLVYGAALVAMMILRPEGLFPNRTRREELHEDAETGPTIEGEAQLGESTPPAAAGATGS